MEEQEQYPKLPKLMTICVEDYDKIVRDNAELKRQVEEMQTDSIYAELLKQNHELHIQLAAREAELAGMTKAKDTFYNDMLLYKEAAEDLIEFRETLFKAIKKRDGKIKWLESEIQRVQGTLFGQMGYVANLESKLAARDARIAELERLLFVVNKALIDEVSGKDNG